ncbi:class I SAM-dependent methyltransferase [Chloroflexota bacterium]
MSFDTSGLGQHWSNKYTEKKYIWGIESSGMARHALAIFKEHELKTLLLAACGYGRNSKLFAENGMDVTGVDTSVVGIEMAREFDHRSNYVCASVLDMPFGGPFDAVFSLNALHLFPKYERARFIAECMKRLRKGGLGYFAVFSEQESSYGRGPKLEENTFESLPGRPAHYYTEEDLRSEFGAYEIVDISITQDNDMHADGPHTHILRYIVAKR